MQDVFIASDHAGFDLKNKIIQQSCIEMTDLGCDNSDAVDYPDYALKIVNKVSDNQRGILICRTGIGMSIFANRFNHVRAALCHNEKSAMLARQHNDANILCIGSEFIDINLTLKIIKIFLDTKFDSSHCRHSKRIASLSSLMKSK